MGCAPRCCGDHVGPRRYLTLVKLIELKLASGMSLASRLQDLADVGCLIAIHSLGEHFAEQLHPHVRAKFAELWHAAHARDPFAE
jgi:hypothetical protein